MGFIFWHAKKLFSEWFFSILEWEWNGFFWCAKSHSQNGFFHSRMGKTHSEWFFIRRAMGMEWFSEILDGKNHSWNGFFPFWNGNGIGSEIPGAQKPFPEWFFHILGMGLNRFRWGTKPF